MSAIRTTDNLAVEMLRHVRLGVELQRELDQAADECEGKTQQEISEIYRRRLDKVFNPNRTTK
jgi:phytoene/squalene synthetase